MVGFGANLRDPGFGAELLARATSVEAEAGVVLAREDVLARTLAAFGDWLAVLEAGNVARIQAALATRDAAKDQPILLDGVAAIARGIDASGALLVERDGNLAAVTSGTVELRSWGA